MAPGSEPVAQGRRTHPLSGLVQGLRWAGAAIVAIVGSAFGSDGWGGVPLLIALPAALLAGAAIGVAAGFWVWWSTRYFIDATEVRVESGIVWHTSRRVPFERIQSVDINEPLIARIARLAELRIDSAGGKETRTRLRYLPLAECRALRQLVLERAHGRAADTTEPADELITVVPPQRLVIATLLTLDFAIALGGTVVALVIALVVAIGEFSIAGIGALGLGIPAGVALAQLVFERVIAEWDFRLSRTATGLRIERGLLSRNSQTIPFHRVQGVAIREPYLWRRLGWARVEVDVAGQAAQASETSNGNKTKPTLLPIADPDLLRAVIGTVIPGGADLPTRVDRPPARSRWFAPIGWRYRWVGATDFTFTSRSGWVQRSTDVIPHARTQSVALRQGPLQRRRDLATVQAHTPDGPVHAQGRHLDAATAREVAFAQLARARRSR